MRSMSDPGVPSIIRGMNDVLRAEGYSLIVCSADGDAGMVEREAELQLSRQVDLLFFHLQGETVSSLGSLNTDAIPVIYVEQQPSESQGYCIGLRELLVGQMAASHLIQSGASRIAYLRGPRTAAADERFAGFSAGHARSGHGHPAGMDCGRRARGGTVPERTGIRGKVVRGTCDSRWSNRLHGPHGSGHLRCGAEQEVADSGAGAGDRVRETKKTSARCEAH